MVTEIVILCFALALIGAMRLIAELFKVAHASREGDQFRALKRYQIDHAHAAAAEDGIRPGDEAEAYAEGYRHSAAHRFRHLTGRGGDSGETPEPAFTNA